MSDTWIQPVVCKGIILMKEESRLCVTFPLSVGSSATNAFTPERLVAMLWSIWGPFGGGQPAKRMAKILLDLKARCILNITCRP
jgi:hypothetical protein